MGAGNGPDAAAPPLLVIRGDASAEEVAALVAVLQAMAGSAAQHTSSPRPSEWSAPRRRLRPPLAAGPGGWRASRLPR
jgi:Acyl-CoA carboxylase epsilon subunit